MTDRARMMLACQRCGERWPDDAVMEAVKLHVQVEHDTDDVRLDLIVVCACNARMDLHPGRAAAQRTRTPLLRLPRLEAQHQPDGQGREAAMPDPHLPQIPIAQRVLIYHQRLDIGSCACGWGVDSGALGKSHAAHVLSVLREDPDVVDGMAEAMTGWPLDTAAEEDAEAWRQCARDALAYLTGEEAADAD